MWEGKVFALLLLDIDRLLLQRILVVRPKGLGLFCFALVAFAQLLGIGRRVCPELGVEAMIQAEPRWFIATAHIKCKLGDVGCCSRAWICISILLWSIRNGRIHRLRWGRLCLGSQDHGSCEEELKAWRRRRGSRWRVGHGKSIRYRLDEWRNDELWDLLSLERCYYNSCLVQCKKCTERSLRYVSYAGYSKVLQTGLCQWRIEARLCRGTVLFAAQYRTHHFCSHTTGS